MLNYIRSEFYRILHGRAIYVMLAAFAVIIVLLNFFLAYGDRMFGSNAVPEATFYSYQYLLVSPVVFYLAAMLVVYLIYAGKNGGGATYKNTVAAGLSRGKLLVARCLVAGVVTLAAMAITVAIWIVAAQLMLAPSPDVNWLDIVSEAAAMTPIVLASVVLSVALFTYGSNNLLAVVIWFVIFQLVPSICLMLAARLNLPIFADAASWMPAQFIANTVDIGNVQLIWNTASGLTKLIVSGLAGVVVFGGAGLALMRRKELD